MKKSAYSVKNATHSSSQTFQTASRLNTCTNHKPIYSFTEHTQQYQSRYNPHQVRRYEVSVNQWRERKARWYNLSGFQWTQFLGPVPNRLINSILLFGTYLPGAEIYSTTVSICGSNIFSELSIGANRSILEERYFLHHYGYRDDGPRFFPFDRGKTCDSMIGETFH